MDHAVPTLLPRRLGARPTAQQPFGSLPRPVHVLVLQRWFPAVAHSVRVTRRGHQTLVSLGNHLTWVPTSRVACEVPALPEALDDAVA